VTLRTAADLLTAWSAVGIPIVLGLRRTTKEFQVEAILYQQEAVGLTA
jgi:hypothetical protein